MSAYRTHSVSSGLLQVYVIRQAFAKSFIAYSQKFVDERSKKELKDQLAAYD